MPISRRHFMLQSAAAALAAGVGARMPDALAQNGPVQGGPVPGQFVPDADVLFPHRLPDRQSLRPDRLVISHWHYFPISLDNAVAENDFYTRGYLDPKGENGKHAAYGGFLRDRPLPRPPIPAPDWPLVDAETDVRRASQAGIDAFQLNVMSLRPRDMFYRYLTRYLDAVERLDTAFRIIPCIDCLGEHNNAASPEELARQLAPILQRKGILRMADGRPMLSCFLYEWWKVDRWQKIFAELDTLGIKPYFAPMFLRTTDLDPKLLAMADMVGGWAGNHMGGVDAVADLHRRVRDAGKAFMWSVWPQDYRPKDGWYNEAHNSLLFRTGFERGIAEDVACINVMTWNDYSESSQIAPSSNTGYAFADLTRFYADWYKSGSRPEIVRDVLFYFHRRDFAARKFALMSQPSTAAIRYGPGPFDEIELLAFLKEPGRLEIIQEALTTGKDADAGMTSLFAPLATGPQRLRLSRQGAAVMEVESAFAVRANPEIQNLAYCGGRSRRT